MNSLYHLICLWILFGVCFLFEIPHAQSINWDPNFNQFQNPNRKSDVITIRIPMAWSDTKDAWVPDNDALIEITSISRDIRKDFKETGPAGMERVFEKAKPLMNELKGQFSARAKYSEVNEQEYARAFQNAAFNAGMDTITIPIKTPRKYLPQYASKIALSPRWHQIDFNGNNQRATPPDWQIAYTYAAQGPAFPHTYDRLSGHMSPMQRPSDQERISSGIQVLCRHWFIIIAFCCVGLLMIAIYLGGFGFRQCRRREIRMDRRRVMMRRQKALESHPHVVPVATMV